MLPDQGQTVVLAEEGGGHQSSSLHSHLNVLFICFCYFHFFIVCLLVSLLVCLFVCLVGCLFVCLFCWRGWPSAIRTSTQGSSSTSSISGLGGLNKAFAIPLESEAPPWFAVLSMLPGQFLNKFLSLREIHFRGMQRQDIVMVIHYRSSASIFLFRHFERKSMLQESALLKICEYIIWNPSKTATKMYFHISNTTYTLSKACSFRISSGRSNTPCWSDSSGNDDEEMVWYSPHISVEIAAQSNNSSSLNQVWPIMMPFPEKAVVEISGSFLPYFPC